MSGLIDFAFDYCMGEEGNALYTNDPRDPGGPTKYGIALNANRATIPDKNGDGIINAEDVKLLSREDAKRIFTQKYWKPNQGDELPPAIAFYYVDCCFNPGPGAASRLLQKALYALGMGIAVDGKVGPKTLAAARVVDPAKLLPELAAQRQMYYASRKGWGVYGLGWTRRVSRCLVQALNLTTLKQGVSR